MKLEIRHLRLEIPTENLALHLAISKTACGASDNFAERLLPHLRRDDINYNLTAAHINDEFRHS